MRVSARLLALLLGGLSVLSVRADESRQTVVPPLAINCSDGLTFIHTESGRAWLAGYAEGYIEKYSTEVSITRNWDVDERFLARLSDELRKNCIGIADTSFRGRLRSVLPALITRYAVGG
jgi:hypothetical protein